MSRLNDIANAANIELTPSVQNFAEMIAQHAAEIANFMEDTQQPDIGDAILEYFGLK